MGEISVKAKLQDDLKAAMKASDKPRMMTIRGVLSEITRIEKDVCRAANEVEIVQVLKRERTRREEALEFARQAKRADLVAQNEIEAKILEDLSARRALIRRSQGRHQRANRGGRGADRAADEGAARPVRRASRWQDGQRSRQAGARAETVRSQPWPSRSNLSKLKWRTPCSRTCASGWIARAFPDEVPDTGWEYGANLAYMKELVDVLAHAVRLAQARGRTQPPSALQGDDRRPRASFHPRARARPESETTAAVPRMARDDLRVHARSSRC